MTKVLDFLLKMLSKQYDFNKRSSSVASTVFADFSRSFICLCYLRSSLLAFFVTFGLHLLFFLLLNILYYFSHFLYLFYLCHLLYLLFVQYDYLSPMLSLHVSAITCCLCYFLDTGYQLSLTIFVFTSQFLIWSVVCCPLQFLQTIVSFDTDTLLSD